MRVATYPDHEAAMSRSMSKVCLLNRITEAALTARRLRPRKTDLHAGQSPQKPATTPYFTGRIDTYRGMFALMVLVGHAMDVSALSVKQIDFFYSSFYQGRVLFGFIWVVGFVVLSGFCIQLSVMNGRPFSIRKFAIMRISRLYPLLIACVMISALTEWIMLGSEFRPKVWQTGVTGREAFINAFFVNLAGLGGFYGQFGSIAPAYTLSYELLYYALWAITLCMLYARPRAGLLINFTIVTAAIFFPEHWRSPLPPFLKQIFSPFILMIYLPWLMGAATALNLEKAASMPAIRAISRYAWIYLFLVVIIGFDLSKMPNWEVSLSSYGYYFLLGISISFLIINAYANKEGPAKNPGGHLMGELSYPIYLTHGPVIVFVGYLLSRHKVELPFLSHFLVLVCSAIFASCVMVVLVERPIMLFRKKVAATKK